MSVYYAPPLLTCARRAVRKARWWALATPVVGGLVGDSYPLPRPSEVADWRDRGHEFTMHPFVESGVEAGYSTYWNQFVKLGYGPISATTRTHRILWQGWVETARVQAAYGIGMSLDYYHVGPAFLGPDGASVFGHFIGSGLPMKFVGEQGEILNVYQQNTPLVDEHMLDALGGQARLTADQAVAVSRQLLENSLKRFPAALGAQFHVDPFERGGPGAENAARWLEGTLAAAAGFGIPIITAERWLAFSEARHDARLDALVWDAPHGRLSFELEIPATPFDLEVLLPAQAQALDLRQVREGGRPASLVTQRQVGGVRYAAVRASSGRHILDAQYAA